MLHIDASKLMWIGTSICTLSRRCLSLRGAIAALRSDGANNGEIASRALEAAERQGKGMQIIEIINPYCFPFYQH